MKAARGLASAAKPGRADLNTENRIIHSEYNILNYSGLCNPIRLSLVAVSNSFEFAKLRTTNFSYQNGNTAILSANRGLDLSNFILCASNLCSHPATELRILLAL